MAVMGIMRHSIIFGGVNSADYGIYIGGEGTFDAPSREVEMVSVPGRNGAVAIDQGHWNNITVTYSAFNYEEDFDTFKQKLSDFRNAIYSKVGYQRLTDTFHPDEYRMAICVDPLDIKPINYTTASQFEIKFNCKPQRWLANGETAIAVASGDTLYNPTQYDAGPLLEVTGSGSISFNGYMIEMINGELGRTLVHEPVAEYVRPKDSSYHLNYFFILYSDLFNDGDLLEFDGVAVDIRARINDTSKKIASVTSLTDGVSVKLTGYTLRIGCDMSGGSAVAGENKLRISEVPYSYRVTYEDSTTEVQSGVVLLGLYYPSASTEAYVSVSIDVGSDTTVQFAEILVKSIYADSTMPAFEASTTFIDCENGEAYRLVNGKYVSLNRYVTLGSDLPVLISGANSIIYDDSITSLKITPNWWKL